MYRLQSWHTVCGCKCKVDKQKYSPKLHTLHLYSQPFWIYWSTYESVFFSCNFYVFKIKYVQKIVKQCQLGTNLWKLYTCFVLFHAATDCSLRTGTIVTSHAFECQMRSWKIWEMRWQWKFIGISRYYIAAR